MSKTTKDVGTLAKIGKIANKALDSIFSASKDTVELSKDEITELMLEAVLEDGKKIYFDDKEKTPGSMVYLMEGEDKLPLPVGTYPMKDGTTLTVAEEGKVGPEVAPAAETESMEEDPMMEAKPETEMADMPMDGEEVEATELEMLSEEMKSAIREMMATELKKLMAEMGMGAETEMEEEMDETELEYTTADKPEEMAKEEVVEEFNHSPSKGISKKADTSWKPSKIIGQRQAIQDQLRAQS